ncbi:hypothetical protein OLEAN_C14090 [Oleispira antarctica RB-8]|uniref:Uncharacterized protein n=1 Tax=Oleispira antarctica RB-8 TaxID=698738 RepID=R4YLV9_OLEAN|nr:hypothetical protein OLEAN_C14090 [Oleispira antarctica RB-8]
MRVTALIESPFQLMQLAEYIAINEIDDYKIIVRLNENEINNTQLLNTLTILTFDKDKCYFSKNRFILTVYLLITYRLLGKLIIGDDNSAIYRVVRFVIPLSFFLFLDDGTSSLNSKVNGDRFTIFDEVNGSKNKLTCITKIIEENSFSVNPERLVILGGKLIEVGICSRNIYIGIIDVMVADIRKKYSKNIVISYIPHRGETEYKSFLTIDYCKKFNIEVIQNELPVEFIAVEKKIKIVGVFGLFSTALFTMKLIYPSSEIKYYIISEYDLLSRKNAVIEFYQMMKGSNLSSSEIPVVTQSAE